MQVDYEKLADECKAKRSKIDWQIAKKGLLDHFRKGSNSLELVKQSQRLKEQEKHYRELARQQKTKEFERQTQQDEKNQQNKKAEYKQEKKNPKIPTHQQKDKEITCEADRRKDMNSFGQMVDTREKINKTTDPQQKKALEAQFAGHKSNWQKEVDAKVQASQIKTKTWQKEVNIKAQVEQPSQGTKGIAQSISKGIGKIAENVIERVR